jgi:phage replication initiation protein
MSLPTLSAASTLPVNAGQARSAASVAGSCSPRPVTRGESIPPTSSAHGAKVDWLNATFAQPDRWTVAQFVDIVGRVIGRELSGVEGRGMFGFERGMKIFVHVGSTTYPIGSLAWGGESQKGRMMLQLTGAGCGVVKSWGRLRKFLSALDARLTRLDLAIDFMNGEYTVDDAVQMLEDGMFNGGGRAPSSSVAGDWIDQVLGRTLYVGKAQNGKMLRVYEKGRQLGNLASDWVRFEVQLGNRDRVIPLEAMTQCNTFLAGCYPALAIMLEEAGEKIATTRTEGAATVGHLMFHLRRSYGKLINIISEAFGANPADLVDELRIIGAPRRLKPDAVIVKLTWAQLIAQCKR